jgi:hypothetical protein
MGCAEAGPPWTAGLQNVSKIPATCKNYSFLLIIKNYLFFPQPAKSQINLSIRKQINNISGLHAAWLLMKRMKRLDWMTRFQRLTTLELKFARLTQRKWGKSLTGVPRP